MKVLVSEALEPMLVWRSLVGEDIKTSKYCAAGSESPDPEASSVIMVCCAVVYLPNGVTFADMFPRKGGEGG